MFHYTLTSLREQVQHNRFRANSNTGTITGPIADSTREPLNYLKGQLPTINRHITCEISNVIYLTSCRKCQKHYVGESSRAFRKRMYEHKASVQKDGQITSVSHHFKSEGHSHKDMKFSVLEWCTPKFEESNTAQ